MDPLTLLIIILIVLVLVGGYGYRSGWHEDTPYWPQVFGVLIAVVISLIVLRLLGRV